MLTAPNSSMCLLLQLLSVSLSPLSSLLSPVSSLSHTLTHSLPLSFSLTLSLSLFCFGLPLLLSPSFSFSTKDCFAYVPKISRFLVLLRWSCSALNHPVLSCLDYTLTIFSLSFPLLRLGRPTEKPVKPLALARFPRLNFSSACTLEEGRSRYRQFPL